MLLGYEEDSLLKLVIGNDDESLLASIDAAFARFMAVFLRNGSITYIKGRSLWPSNNFFSELFSGAFLWGIVIVGLWRDVGVTDWAAIMRVGSVLAKCRG